MADQRIQLRKPLYDEGRVPPPPRGERPAPPRRQVPVFAGFWVRLLALAFDVLLIAVGHNLIAKGSGAEFFYRLGPMCPLLGVALLFILFVIIPVQVWPGQTLGKKLIRLRVVTEDFGEPPVGAYLKRFVLIFAFLLFLSAVEMLGGIQQAFLQWDLPMRLAMGVLFSLYLTQVSLVGTNPVKQGIHDLWAETYVVRLENPDPVPAHAMAQFDELTAHRVRRARRMAIFTMPALILVFSFLQIQQRGGEASEFQGEVNSELSEIVGSPASFFFGEVEIDDGTEPEINPQTGRRVIGLTALALGVVYQFDRSIPWEDLESSESHRETAERLLDCLENQVGVERVNELIGKDLPLGIALVRVVDNYTLLPQFATGQRYTSWFRQRLPLRIDPSQLRGVHLIPPPPPPVAPEPGSPEVSGSPVTDEATSSPASP
ncbi:RDD family protein [Candidatus Sumerlaeota bacterium]|nr:RDD family protein [Candidatus Sumerlaeota bacterium]